MGLSASVSELARRERRLLCLYRTRFLDEALWAGDKQGEGTLKALITEPTFQLEAKFRDPITVKNRLRMLPRMSRRPMSAFRGKAGIKISERIWPTAPRPVP